MILNRLDGGSHAKLTLLYQSGAGSQAEQSGIRELKSSAAGIRRDYATVRAAFTSSWTNGPVETQVNRSKLQTRLMFGRANFDLLRLHVLRRA